MINVNDGRVEIKGSYIDTMHDLACIASGVVDLGVENLNMTRDEVVSDIKDAVELGVCDKEDRDKEAAKILLRGLESLLKDLRESAKEEKHND